jgi:hypothetical protein
LNSGHGLDKERSIITNQSEGIVEAFKKKNHDLCESEAKILNAVDVYFKVSKAVYYDAKVKSLHQLDFKKLKNYLNDFDSDSYVYIYCLMLRRLFEMFLNNKWIRSARILHECLNSCYESVKSGKNTLKNDANLTASYLDVLEFELRYDQVIYLNRVMDETEKPEFYGFDKKTAGIWKKLKDYEEIKELPSEVKDFVEAEKIGRTMLKVHDALEDAYPKYRKSLQEINQLFRGLKNDDHFQPNIKKMARAGVYEVLSSHAETPKMMCKLLNKSNDFRMEHRSYIPADNFDMS